METIASGGASIPADNVKPIRGGVNGDKTRG